MTLTPQDLPGQNANFIAYGQPERASDPRTGDVLTVRPQVYLRYFPSIVVSGIRENGRKGDRPGLMTVSFDPTTAGLRESISAHMEASDSTASAVRQALESKAPIAVAIETQRKKHSSTSKDPISPLVHIHGLRGASHPDGTGEAPQMMSASNDNVTNRLVMVQGVGTHHLVSDPSEWKVLTTNKAGDLPPEGWSLYAAGDSWRDGGALVPAPSHYQQTTPNHQGASQMNSPAPQAFPTPDQITDIVKAAVAQALNEHDSKIESAEKGNIGGRGGSQTRFFEGKPWDVRTSDGRMHLGNYAVGAASDTFQWAYLYLATHPETEGAVEVDPAEAWAFAEATLMLADDVQSMTYGRDFVAHRMLSSHRVAEHWVRFTIENQVPYPQDLTEADGERAAAWCETVRENAVENFAHASEVTNEHFTSRPSVDNHNAPRKKGSESTEPSAPKGPDSTVIRAFLDTVEKAWDRLEAIGNLGATARDHGYGTALVSAEFTDGKVKFSLPPAEGAEPKPVADFMRARWNDLNRQGDQEAPQQEQAPQEQAQPTQGAQEAQSGQQGAQEAQQGAQDSAQQSESYDPQIERVVQALRGVTDSESLRPIYDHLREQNLLGAQVRVVSGDNRRVFFGAAGDQRFNLAPLSIVIQQMVQFFQGPAPAQSPTQTEGTTETARADESTAPEPEAAPEPTSSTTDDAPSTEAAPEPESDPLAAVASSTEPEPAPEPEATPEPAAAEEPAKPEATPEPAAPTAEDAPAPTGDEARAQAIADKARDAQTADECQALIQEAESEGLTEALVSGGSTSSDKGALGKWLAVRLRRLQRSSRA